MSLFLGVLTGLVLGLTGAGGSIFAVPLLMAGLGWTLTQAVPVALLAVAASAALGTYIAWHKSYVRYKTAGLMAGAGMLTSPLGLKASTALPQTALSILFALVLVAVAIRMFLRASRVPEEAAVVRAAVAGDGSHAHGPICRLNANTGRIIWTRPCALMISAIGLVTGFLSGLLGVGGGFVIVPSLRAFTELSMHSAVATSLMAIALTSLGTVAGAVLLGRDLPWLIAVPFVIGALLGMTGGRWLAPYIAGARLQEVFAILMLLVAAGMALHAIST